MLGGYAGKILFVNLSKGSISEELLPELVCREFVGGYGLGIRVLYEKMKAGVAPLGEELFFRGFAYPALKQRWGTMQAVLRWNSPPTPQKLNQKSVRCSGMIHDM